MDMVVPCSTSERPRRRNPGHDGRHVGTTGSGAGQGAPVCMQSRPGPAWASPARHGTMDRRGREPRSLGGGLRGDGSGAPRAERPGDLPRRPRAGRRTTGRRTCRDARWRASPRRSCQGARELPGSTYAASAGNVVVWLPSGSPSVSCQPLRDCGVLSQAGRVCIPWDAGAVAMRHRGRVGGSRDAITWQPAAFTTRNRSPWAGGWNPPTVVGAWFASRPRVAPCVARFARPWDRPRPEDRLGPTASHRPPSPAPSSGRTAARAGCAPAWVARVTCTLARDAEAGDPTMLLGGPPDAHRASIPTRPRHRERALEPRHDRTPASGSATARPGTVATGARTGRRSHPGWISREMDRGPARTFVTGTRRRAHVTVSRRSDLLRCVPMHGMGAAGLCAALVHTSAGVR